MEKENKKDMLEVVNGEDGVIGLEERSVVHQKGLLHREIHVWFMTPKKEIIFQHRAKDKDTYPDKLDATVGGHVDPGMSYDDTAIKEVKEEAGLDLNLSKLKLVKKLFSKSFDETTGCINNTIRSYFVYLYEGDIKDLKIEGGKGIGFEAWKIDSLRNLSIEDKNKFIPLIISDESLKIFEEGEKLLGLI